MENFNELCDKIDNTICETIDYLNKKKLEILDSVFEDEDDELDYYEKINE